MEKPMKTEELEDEKLEREILENLKRLNERAAEIRGEPRVQSPKDNIKVERHEPPQSPEDEPEDEIRRERDEELSPLIQEILKLKETKEPEEAFNEEPALPLRTTITPEELRLEIDLDIARKDYADAYREFMADRKENLGFLKSSKEKIFGAKIKTEDLSDELKIREKKLRTLEERYDKVAVAYGNEMLRAQEAYVNSNLKPEDRDAALALYKQKDIFEKIIIVEQEKLNILRAENLPPKEKNVFKKGMDWYVGLDWKKKLIVSVPLSVGVFVGVSLVIAPGAIAAAGGGLTVGGIRAARTIAGTTIGHGATKMYDLIFRDKSADQRELEKLFLSKYLEQNELDEGALSYYKMKYTSILEKEKKSKRRRLIAKAMVGLVAGGAASVGTAYGAGRVISSTPGQINTPGAKPSSPAGGNAPSATKVLPAESAPATQEAPAAGIAPSQPAQGVAPAPEKTDQPFAPTSPPETPKGTASGELGEKSIATEPALKGKAEGKLSVENKAEANIPQTAETIDKTDDITITFDKGKGAIAGIRELQLRIREEYGADYASRAPQGVKNFAETDATKIAIDNELYIPGDTKESALIEKGSQISVDKDGNLYFAKPSDEMQTLIKEQKFKMFDSEQRVSRPKVVPEGTLIGKNLPSSEKIGDMLPTSEPASTETTGLGLKKNEFGQRPTIAEGGGELAPAMKIAPTPPIEPRAIKIPSTFDEALARAKQNVLDSYGESKSSRGLGPTEDVGRDIKARPSVAETQQNPLPSEFVKNPYRLTNNELVEVYQVYEKAKSHMASASGYETVWKEIKNLPINEDDRFKDIVKNKFDEENPVGKFLHNLYKQTKLKPDLDILHKQTIDEWVIKALQKAAKEGVLKKVKL